MSNCPQHGAWIRSEDVDDVIAWMLKKYWNYQFTPGLATDPRYWVNVYRPDRAALLMLRWGSG